MNYIIIYPSPLKDSFIFSSTISRNAGFKHNPMAKYVTIEKLGSSMKKNKNLKDTKRPNNIASLLFEQNIALYDEYATKHKKQITPIIP